MATQALNRTAQKHTPGPPRWTIGQKVWLDAKNLALPYGTIKLAPRRHGPFEIEKVMSPVVYQLRLPPQWTIHPIFHTSLLTPYVETKEHSKNFTRPPPDMIEGEVEYKVEAIWAHCYQRRKLQYLIKWKGYPESDNTWEPADNVQAAQLIRKHHAMHPLEDKRMAEQARTISLTSQPTWLLKSDPTDTFNKAEAVAATLATTAAAVTTAKLSSPLTPEPPPPNLSTLLTSLSGHSFATLPSIPHINSLSLGHAHYQVKIPTFCSPPHSVTSLIPTEMSTHTFAKIITAKLTNKCLTGHTISPMKHTACHITCPASPRPQSHQPVPLLRKSRRLQQLPPSPSVSSPMSLVKTTCRSHQCRPKQSSPSTRLSTPPSTPPPSGSPPPFDSGPNTTPNASRTQDSALSNLNDSTSSATPTIDSCKLDWASSAFLMALNVTREESSPEYQAEEARWLSQRGSDQSGIGLWNYWQGGSQGNPPTLSNSSSALTILRTTRRPQLPGSSPSSPPE